MVKSKSIKRNKQKKTKKMDKTSEKHKPIKLNLIEVGCTCPKTCAKKIDKRNVCICNVGCRTCDYVRKLLSPRPFMSSRPFMSPRPFMRSKYKKTDT